MKVEKICAEAVRACCLGENSPLEQELLRAGSLRRLADGGYEVFSREAADGKGERAEAGDFVKLDSASLPYPNTRALFLANHVLRDGRYVQTPQILEAWDLSMPVPEEIRFLLDSGRLCIDESDPTRTFRAELWGAPLSAPRDAAVLYHKVCRGPDGRVESVSFRFVAREEFEKSYRVVG